MKKHRIKLYTYQFVAEHLGTDRDLIPSYTTFMVEVNDPEWVLVNYRVIHTDINPIDWRLEKVKALELARTTLMKAAETEVAIIDKEIQSLLALEHME